jgi:hypothetical protein
MPRLLTLLPCEKVIVDRDGIPSLIGLFEHLNIAPSEGQDVVEVPKETITFQHWAVFSEWEINESELHLKEVEQILEIQFPDGTIAPIRGKIPFIFNVAGTQRNHQDILGFPVGQEGSYRVRVWLEKHGEIVSEVGTREMKVIHKIPPEKRITQVIGESLA